MKRKPILAIAVTLVAMASCARQEHPVDTVGEQNKEVVKKFMDGITTGDIASATALLADNYMSYGPARKDSVNRQQEMDNWTKSWAEQFSSIKYDEAVVLATTVKPETNKGAAGDWVLKWGTVTVDYKNGTPSVTFNLHTATRVMNGKIDRAFTYYDAADIMTQQGYTFTPPAKEAAK